MTRLHADPVEVRRRDDVPERFPWRGRLYVVPEVLVPRIEAGPEWDGAATRPPGSADVVTWSLARVRDQP